MGAATSARKQSPLKPAAAEPVGRALTSHAALAGMVGHGGRGQLLPPARRPLTLARLKAFTEPGCTRAVLFPTYDGLWNSVRSLAVNCRDQSHTEGNFKPFSSPSWMFLLMANSCKQKRWSTCGKAPARRRPRRAQSQGRGGPAGRPASPQRGCGSSGRGTLVLCLSEGGGSLAKDTGDAGPSGNRVPRLEVSLR